MKCKKEWNVNLISLVVVLFFVFGFIILLFTNSGIIGLNIIDNNFTINVVTITGCDNLTTSNTEYELGNDLYIANWDNVAQTCVNISANNITLDCKGNSIIGNGSFQSRGIQIGKTSVYNNITIKNCNIKNIYYHIYALYINNLTIFNNTFVCESGYSSTKSCYRNYIFMSNSSNISKNNFTNLVTGVSIQGGIGNLISWNNFTNNNIAIHLDTTKNQDKLNITHNTISNSGQGGIYQEDIIISNILVANNSFIDNVYAFQFLYGGINLSIEDNTIKKEGNQTDFRIMCQGRSRSECNTLKVENNTLNGKEIKFFGGNNTLECPNNTIMNLTLENAGHIGLIGCKNITIEDFSFNATNGGITLLYTNETIIKNNYFYPVTPITASYDDNTTIKDNKFFNNTGSSSAASLTLYGLGRLSLINNTFNSTKGAYNIYTVDLRTDLSKVENNTFVGYSYPLSLFDVNNVSVKNNIFKNMMEIPLIFAYNVTFNDNYIQNTKLGISAIFSSDNMIANNTIINSYDDYVPTANTRMTIRENKIKNSFSGVTTFNGEKYGNINELFNFSITLKYSDDNPVNSFVINEIRTRPLSVVSYHNESNIIYGNFTPSNKGFYSLLINYTDDNNNTIYNTLVYLVNAHQKTTRYYLRKSLSNNYPIKSLSDNIYGLSTSEPTSEEELIRDAKLVNDQIFYWQLLNSPEVASLIQKVELGTWYKTSPDSTYMVVEVHFGDTSGSKTLSSTLTNYSWTTFVYNTNWSIVHPLFWNYFHVSFNNWGSMSWKTNTSDMSYVNMTYKYGAYPVIKDLSNPLINVLSATMPNDESSAQVVVEGEGWTNMTVVMPGSVEDVYYDGIQHNLTGNCNVTIRGSTVYIDLAVGSEHIISITTPSAEEGGFGINLGNTKNILMQKGVPKFIEFNNPNLPVVGVEVVLNEEALLDLEARRVPDSYIIDKLEGSYAYFELKSSLSGSYFDSIIITFKVEKEFDDVKLYQLSGTWNKIDTTQIYEDNKYNYYQAAVGSLGYFGLASEKYEAQVITSLESGLIEEPILKEVKSITPVEIMLLLVLLVIGVVFYRNRRIYFK